MNQGKNKTLGKKAVFFDRDGGLNKDFGYVYKTKDLEWINGAKESINMLKNLGYLIIVVTNQSGVHRGFYSENDVKKFHEFMNVELKNEVSVIIDDFFFATDNPNVKENNLTRRKPNPKMIFEAFEKYNIDKDQSFLVGDKETDILAAKNAGIRGFLFNGNNLLYFVKNILKT